MIWLTVMCAKPGAPICQATKSVESHYTRSVHREQPLLLVKSYGMLCIYAAFDWYRIPLRLGASFRPCFAGRFGVVRFHLMSTAGQMDEAPAAQCTIRGRVTNTTHIFRDARKECYVPNLTKAGQTPSSFPPGLTVLQCCARSRERCHRPRARHFLLKRRQRSTPLSVDATLTIIVTMVASPLQPRGFNGRRRDVVWLARFHRPIALLSFINEIARRLDRRRQGSHKLIAPFTGRFGVGVQSGSDGERYVQLYMCELVHIGQAGSIAA